MLTAILLLAACADDPLAIEQGAPPDPERVEGRYDIVQWTSFSDCEFTPDGVSDVTADRPVRMRTMAVDGNVQVTTCSIGECTEEFDPYLPEADLAPVDGSPGRWADSRLFYGIEGPDDEICTAYVAERELVEQADGSITVTIMRRAEVQFDAEPDRVCQIDNALSAEVFFQDCAEFERIEAVPFDGPTGEPNDDDDDGEGDS